MECHVALVAVAEIRADVGRPLVGLSQQHATGVIRINRRAKPLDYDMRFGEILAIGAVALHQVRNCVESQRIDTILLISSLANPDRAKKLAGEMAALCRDRLKNDTRAETWAQIALARDPTNPDEPRVMGEVAYDEESFVEATRYFEPAASFKISENWLARSRLVNGRQPLADVISKSPLEKRSKSCLVAALHSSSLLAKYPNPERRRKSRTTLSLGPIASTGRLAPTNSKILLPLSEAVRESIFSKASNAADFLSALKTCSRGTDLNV